MHQHIKKLIVPAMLTIGTSFAAVIVKPTSGTATTGGLIMAIPPP